MKSNYWRILLMLLCLLAPGCFEITKSDIIGTWRLEKRPDVNAITFYDDGICVFHDLPPAGELSREQHLRAITGHWVMVGQHILTYDYLLPKDSVHSDFEVSRDEQGVYLYRIRGVPDRSEEGILRKRLSFNERKKLEGGDKK